MIKKFFLIFVIFTFSLSLSVFAAGEKQAYQDALKAKDDIEKQLKNSSLTDKQRENLEGALEYQKSVVGEKKEAYENSPEAADDITAPGFQITVGDITPGMKPTGDTTQKTVNYALGTIIQNLMIGLGSLALLIMTVGAGYIILHHGQDELLSKGKTIFMSGVYALVIALSSYYLISIVRYILFFGDN